jgi:hypothetical protein
MNATYTNPAATTTFVVTPPMTVVEEAAWAAKFVAGYEASVKSMRAAAQVEKDGTEGWEDALLAASAGDELPAWAR